MIQFNGALVLANDTPKTILELVRTAIAARTYPTAQQETDALNRFGSGRIIDEGFIRPEGDIYMIDAYKGVLNGVVTAADWADADFTGGGEPLLGGIERHFGNRTDPGTRVLYQNSGGDITVWVDMSFG